MVIATKREYVCFQEVRGKGEVVRVVKVAAER